MSIEFVGSQDLTIGMEMEFQLVDATSFELVDGVLPLLKYFPDNPFIKSEFIQNTIEVASAPCADVAQLEKNVRSLIAALIERCEDLGMRLCGAGTHPFSRRLAIITPLPRYQAMEETYGLISRTQITFATHVHIGVKSGDEAVLLMSELKSYLPMLLALSANSPYWRGYETGFSSYRQRILASSRTYGMPPDFEDWEAFERFFETSTRAGMFESIHDIHWDIRPRPHFGTVEVRIMDAQPCVTSAVALGALIRSLVVFLRASRDKQNLRPCEPLPWWANKDNCYSASRLGVNASVMTTERGDTKTLQNLIDETIGIVGSTAQGLGEQRFIEQLPALARHPGYQQQLQIGRKQPLKEVVRTLAETLVSEVSA